MLELARPTPGFVTVTETKDLLDVVRSRAIARWGERHWQSELARATVEIFQRTDPTATYTGRRRQLYRVFEEYSCTSSTLLALIEAAGCRLQLVCTDFKTIDF